MKITYVYYFAAVGNAADDKLNEERRILEISLESLRSVDHDADIMIVTNSRFADKLDANLFEEIIIDENILLENLDYMRVIHQRNIIERHAKSKKPKRLCFIDHDILFSENIALFFNYNFDFAITANFNTSFSFGSFGLPINTGVASINAGVQLCNASPKSLSFVNEKINRCKWAEENKESIPTPLCDSPLQWGCDQISMMLMLNKEIFMDHKKLCDYKGCKVKIFSTNALNFTPKVGKSILLSEFFEHWIWHFKGNRKPTMLKFWSALKQSKMIDPKSLRPTSSRPFSPNNLWQNVKELIFIRGQ